MLTPQDLMEVRKIVVAAKLLDSGAFDTALDKMEAQYEERIAASEASAQSNHEVRMAALAEQEKKLSDIEARTQRLRDSADEQLAKIDEARVAAESAQETAAQELSDLRKEAAAFRASVETERASLAAQRTELEQAQSELADAKADLAAREAELARKLAAMKELATA